MSEEIALFIDFENIRYSLLNTQHREPDPQELINIARKYGIVMVAKAYADWTRQPEMFKGSLTAAMIDRVDCPAKQRDRLRQVSVRDASDSGIWSSSSVNIPVQTAGDEEVNHFSGSSQSVYTTQSSTQSTVDLNMLMDIIETVFDRPNISTFVLMTGDRDFTRICARLKLRLNKNVIVAGVPGTVSRDLLSAANSFVLLSASQSQIHTAAPATAVSRTNSVLLDPLDPQFMQFLDYIDRHWSWRTIVGVSNFIGDPYNHKNRFRGKLTRESARDLLQICIDQGILIQQFDNVGNEDLRLNRDNAQVANSLTVLRTSDIKPWRAAAANIGIGLPGNGYVPSQIFSAGVNGAVSTDTEDGDMYYGSPEDPALTIAGIDPSIKVNVDSSLLKPAIAEVFVIEDLRQNTNHE